MGGYLLADHLHISGPLAMVMAGIITGNKSMEESMSDITRDYIDKFWQMMDEVLNAILFLLIGFEMLIIPFNITMLWLGCISINNCFIRKIYFCCNTYYIFKVQKNI